MTLTAIEIQKFQKKILDYYAKNKRDLPWRNSPSPYEVFVSELMLQQTQVDRVIPKYAEFMQAFPTFVKLAESSQADVLRVWSGLGYNRRALYLQKSAQMILDTFNGKLPKDIEDLQLLSGVGPNTAASIAAYAYDTPVVYIETNIRTIYIHEFYPDITKVDDADLLLLIEQTVYEKSPSTWYNALMDYGVMIKKSIGNISKKSKHYAKQSKFSGSNRELRGMILRLLMEAPKCKKEVGALDEKNHERVESVLSRLTDEGFIEKIDDLYKLKN